MSFCNTFLNPQGQGSLAMLLLGAEMPPCLLLSLPLCCGVHQMQMPAGAFS